MYRRINLISSLAALALAALVVAGCGSSGGDGTEDTHPDYATALKGAPAPLAALYEQSNELLPGGVEAFEKQMAELKGHPVVVNVWASWCGPCQFEFPTLQKLSAQYGKKVAFVGINAEDDTAAAKTFLREDPVPYPSFEDAHKDIARSIGAEVGFPDTVFFDKNGKAVHVKIGAYAHDSELEADVRKYGLNE